MAHVAEYKKEIVKKIVGLIKSYPIIGIVNMENLPAPQLQRLRGQLRGKVELFMAKRRLISLAIDNTKDLKPGIENLKQYLSGMPAVICTNDNPFMLFKVLKKSKSTAPAKPGQKAPADIVVKAGPTSFAPGPIIGELGALGIKTGVENGKVAIKEDAVVCKEGQPISAPLAAMLTRLGIEPMEVGLDLKAVYENGTIFTKDILDIDEEEFLRSISEATKYAMNLSVEIGYTTRDNIELILTKLHNEAKTVALEAAIITDITRDDLLAKAHSEMLSLASTANIEITEKPRSETTKEEQLDANHQTKDEKLEKSDENKGEDGAQLKQLNSKDEKNDKIEENVKKLVEMTKRKAAGNEPTTEELLSSVDDSKGKETPKHVNGKNKIDDNRNEQKEVERLAQELVQKGTLRK